VRSSPSISQSRSLMFSYEEATQYVNSFINYEKKPDFSYNKRFLNLQRTSYLLSLLGNPHRSFRSVHIAGTKGKGTTSAILTSILRAGGYKAGLYTSPHLVSPRERIRIGERLIEEEEFAYFLFHIKERIEKKGKVSLCSNLTFFEIYTALAFLYFAHQKVDLAVVEVGLGGRLDATNVISPLVGVITQISLDHTKQLGNNLSSIAREKSGIIKDGTKVVTSPQERVVLSMIEEVCRRKKAFLYRVGRDIKFKKIESRLKGQSFSLQTRKADYPYLFLPLSGEHQIVNAATAVGVIELLQGDGVFVSREAVARGLNEVRWLGRVQVLSEEPLFIVDCAHNGASAQALADFLGKISSKGRLFLILGILKNKDVEAIGKALCPLADEVILTEADSPRALPCEELERRIAGLCRKRVTLKKNVDSAIAYARFLAKKEDLICLTGSVYLAGEALKIMGEINV